jgi:hypothetical protein
MQRIPVYAAWLAAGLVTAFTIRYASFTPSSVGVPIGSRAGAIQGTYVPMYPLGFPVLLAVGVLADADLGVYLIAPHPTDRFVAVARQQ